MSPQRLHDQEWLPGCLNELFTTLPPLLSRQRLLPPAPDPASPHRISPLGMQLQLLRPMHPSELQTYSGYLRGLPPAVVLVTATDIGTRPPYIEPSAQPSSLVREIMSTTIGAAARASFNLDTPVGRASFALASGLPSGEGGAIDVAELSVAGATYINTVEKVRWTVS